VLDPAKTGTERLDRRLVALFAIATGVAVANIYYVQPLIDVIAEAFDISGSAAGLLVALSQLGYLVGLAFVVPLGDLLERRRLIVSMLALAALAAAACAAAPEFAVLAAALVLLGLLSVAAQIIVPLASSLAGEAERGQIVGTVMSGLLIGILSARIFSGLIAELAGWRGVYVVAASVLAALALILRQTMPPAPPPQSHLNYGQTLRSVLQLVRREPVLRQRMALGFCCFASFGILWSSLTYLLSGSPFGYGEGLIGLFGLAGVAGASIAPVSGRLADRGHARLALTGFLCLILLGWGVLALGRSSAAVLVVGIVIFDLGTQGAQINNQAAIYALEPSARSRITTAFLVSGFCGITLGSTLAALLYPAAGWYAVCGVGAGLIGAALAIWATTQGLGSRAHGRRWPPARALPAREKGSR
jgi:predicted MFS family arabinose efflux permease